MANNNQIQIVKDLPNRKITITRKFEAPLEDVWRAWTERDLLDKWWMPKPWVAKTKSLSFEVGGNWLFSTKGGKTNSFLQAQEQKLKLVVRTKEILKN